LLGHRIFIINKARQAEFNRIKSLEDLKLFTAGQGIGWQDLEILKAAGLPVFASKYDLLFKMLAAGRIDYFPRGANEPFGELAARGNSAASLAVESNLMLIYPFDLFFYTSKENEVLASAIEKGLQAAYADGSYLALFNNDEGIRRTLAEARLKDRTRIAIDNPLLSAEDKKISGEYWLQKF
jgi:ABC-type amino acid transport substrate-binding protein